MTMMREMMIRTIIVDDGDDGFPQGFWVELEGQGPCFSIRMVIDIFCSDTVQINQYSQILRRPCCLEINSNEIGLIKEGVS